MTTTLCPELTAMREQAKKIVDDRRQKEYEKEVDREFIRLHLEDSLRRRNCGND